VKPRAGYDLSSVINRIVTEWAADAVPPHVHILLKPTTSMPGADFQQLMMFQQEHHPMVSTAS